MRLLLLHITTPQPDPSAHCRPISAVLCWNIIPSPNLKSVPCASLSPPLPPRCCPLQDKILQSMGRGNEVTITNDGATILKSIYVDNPAAKVLVGGCARRLHM